MEDRVSKTQVIGLIVLAYLFSIAIRLIWVYQFSSDPSYCWNDQLMINTNDGYFFASGAQKALEGTLEFNPRVPNLYTYATTWLTALITKITPFSLESVTLYMPAVISSMVVIPIILLGRIFGVTLLGFFAALIGSIAWSYYNRTMVGYYDTDMFAAMAPMFILMFFINSIHRYTLKSALYASLAIVIYPFLYDQGKAIVDAMGVIYFAYLLLYHRGEDVAYKSIILIAASMIPIGLFVASPYSYIIGAMIVLGIYYILQNQKIENQNLFILMVVSIIAFMYFGNVFGLIYGKVAYYLSRSVEDHGLKFFQVNQTVREAGTIPFSTMANRISGSTIGVIVSLIGYILLVIRYRPFILALPLIGIGVFSLWGGLRFTVYAVPIAAIGAVYLFFVLSNLLEVKWQKYLFIAGATIWMLYPNIKHIIGYKVPTVFINDEVKILDELKSKSNPKDYVISWWDYGYPIWYYSGLNTLIDGGKHGHDNYIVSKILNTPSQLQSANLSRVAIETYVSSDYQLVSDTLFKNGKKDQLNPNDYLENLESEDFSPPKKTRDVFLYLPNRMLNIFPTVGLFSNLNLVNGNKYQNPFFYQTSRFKDAGDIIHLGNGISLLKKQGILSFGKNQTQIRRFVIVGYSKDGTLQKNIQEVNPNASISVIFMQSYGKFLVLDENLYSSTFIKLFVLEEYDKNLFEPVIMHPLAKVYKIKI
jgi:dolichyl-diphosphooligosaccharide--protein glycosyltransferase/undecaprenyl-diphosphooligosaccharide--protein glycosyltransferase